MSDPQRDETERACIDCRARRPIGDFYSKTLKKNVLSCGSCRSAKAIRNDLYRAGLGEGAIRAKNLWTKYKITVDEYDKWRESQGYRCAICGDHEDDIPAMKGGRPRKDGKPSETAFNLVVDHCHDSSQVRGLLCHRCNCAIGLLRESPAIAEAAALYIREACLSVPNVTKMGV